MAKESELCDENHKMCSKCGKILPLDCFYKGAGYSKGVRGICKECSKEWDENRKNNNPCYYKEHYAKNKERIKKKSRLWYQKNKERAEEYRKERRPIIRERERQRRKTDPIYSMKRRIRIMISNSFRKVGYSKSQETSEIIGMNLDDFDEYLRKTFANRYGYEWDNVEPVHIDHIIPLATAKTEEDVMKLCNYSNLQLLKAKDNLIKSSRLDWE